MFATPRNPDELTPPDLRSRTVSDVPARRYAGQLIEYRSPPLSGAWLRRLTEIRRVRAGEYFVDEQRGGPYQRCYHERCFEAVSGGVMMTDRVARDVGWDPAGGRAGRSGVT